jgi:hypothetical protein
MITNASILLLQENLNRMLETTPLTSDITSDLYALSTELDELIVQYYKQIH